MRAALTQAGVQIDDSGRGKMKFKAFSADVIPEPDGFIAVRVDVDAWGDPTAALERCSMLPNNVRFSVTGMRWRLAAETHTDGTVHLFESMTEIQEGFAAAVTKRKLLKRPSTADPDVEVAMREAIKARGWTDEQCVETDDGWELQPRLAGEAVPVRVRVVAHGVQASRPVLGLLPDKGPARLAVSHQALMFNERLRFTRLAATEGQLVVESQLRTELIDPDWLEFAARAVASAAKEVTPTMRVLSQEESLCKRYTELFLDP